MKIERTKEVWREVHGFGRRYSVSNYGRVISIINGKVRELKGGYCRGYRRVNLSEKTKVKCLIVARLVAQAFHPNPRNLPQVNHINGQKDDNYWENLEWMTCEENNRHARQTGLRLPEPKGGLSPRAKKVQCVETGEIFKSLIDAKNKYPAAGDNIGPACKGIARKSAGGYTWRYV